jgi:AcrR family transcriptional regulator
MSPKLADPNRRTALIEAAARIIALEGPAALSARRLAGEVDSSTSAVYTDFGGMPELRRAVRREGFVRLAQHLDGVKATDDPVADLARLGWAYSTNALANPHLYRVMFMESPIDGEDALVGWDTFERLVSAVQRCMVAGRFPRCPDPLQGALQIWTMTHGVVSVVLTGMIDQDQAQQVLSSMGASVFVGLGDDGESVRDSLARGRPA